MKEKMPIEVLIGRGTRLPALLEHLRQPDSAARITLVVSHKALDNDNQDVPGIAAAKRERILALYWNLVQWRQRTGLEREDFDNVLGWFISQSYFGPPEAVFLLGWDLILSQAFLTYFPRPDGYYNVINLHPALLPDNPADQTIKLSTGEEIPVLKGEHDEVIQKALELKLPALGSTMHFVVKKADFGPVIKRVEIPIGQDETLESFEKKLLVAENQLVIDVVDLFTQGKINIKNSRVKIKE